MKFEHLEVAEGPVVSGLEELEIIFAKSQPEYRPLRALLARDTGRILTRWSPTPAQRQAIVEGADVFLEVMTFGQPLQPVLLSIGERPDAHYLVEMGLPVEAVLDAEILNEDPVRERSQS